MLKLFRVMRENLLTDGKIKKYLMYAIGEIILVVIGILIALKINNLNIESNTRKLEISTLKEIKQALIQDTLELNSNISKLELKTKQIETLIQHIENKKPYKSSLDTLFNSAYVHVGYKAFNLSAYDLLKERGIDIIGNNNLRRKISQHYTISYQRLIGWLERLEKINLIQGNKMYDNFRVNWDAVHPYEYENIINKPEHMGPFYHFRTMTKSYRFQLTDFKSKSSRLLSLIDMELDSRTNK